jgi:hypothetical protein
MDSQEHEEAPRITNIESRPLRKCPYFRAVMYHDMDSKTSNVQ